MKKIKFLFYLFWISNFVDAQNFEIEHPPPVPEFSAINICFGDSTHFINQTLGGTYFHWVIRYIDTAQNDTVLLDSIASEDLTYYFNSTGDYLVTMYADNGHLVQITKTITIGNILSINFDFQQCTNNFINMSTCASQMHWNFGDGVSDTGLTMSHFYSDTGYYDVTCIASNGANQDTLVKQIYVHDLGYPQLDYLYNIVYDTLFGEISNVGPLGSYFWYFGDGTSANTASVVHVYSDTSATYTLTVRAINTCGSKLENVFIDVPDVSSLKKNTDEKNNIFPNPSSDFLYVKLPGMNSIVVYNLQGRKILEHKNLFLIDDFQLDIRSIEAGQYFVSIETINQVYHQKFIKQ